MLLLNRKVGGEIVLLGRQHQDIIARIVVVNNERMGRVQIGIDADAEVVVLRGEIADAETGAR